MRPQTSSMKRIKRSDMKIDPKQNRAEHDRDQATYAASYYSYTHIHAHREKG